MKVVKGKILNVNTPMEKKLKRLLKCYLTKFFGLNISEFSKILQKLDIKLPAIVEDFEFVYHAIIFKFESGDKIELYLGDMVDPRVIYKKREYYAVSKNMELKEFICVDDL